MIAKSVLIAPVLIALMGSSLAFGQSTSATSTPDPPPALDFWHQETMTGDWGGTRSRWKEKGIELEFKYVGIFQSIASGCIEDKSSLTHKL